MEQDTEVQLTLFQEDSLVSPLVLPGSERARKMTVTSGLKCSELLGRSSRVGSWAKTFTGLLIGMEGWFSNRCNLTWKLKATTSQRMYCQLQVSMHPIKDTGYGLSRTMLNMTPSGRRKIIPTPVALDGLSPSLAEKLRSDETIENVSTLAAYVKHNWHKLVPTPTCFDASGSSAKMQSTQIKEGSMHSITLCRWAHMLSTLTVNDQKQLLKSANWKGGDLASQIQGRTGEIGQLNPRFVAEMMGFPINWTELPFENGDEIQ